MDVKKFLARSEKKTDGMHYGIIRPEGLRTYKNVNIGIHESGKACFGIQQNVCVAKAPTHTHTYFALLQGDYLDRIKMIIL